MKNNQLHKMIYSFVAILLCGVVVLLERHGVPVTIQQKLQSEPVKFTKKVEMKNDCLMIKDASDEDSLKQVEQMEIVLQGMKVNYDVLDIGEVSFENGLKDYTKLIIGFSDWNKIGDNMLCINDWVKNGGAMMNLATPNPGSAFYAMSQIIGIEDSNNEYTSILGFAIEDNCMIGSDVQDEYLFSDGESLTTSLNVRLSDDSKVYVSSEDHATPILWSHENGEGKFVIINDVILSKFQRGFWCLAYSLLDDVSIYPVINASSFYLDDFPSPVPIGNGVYIERDYGVNIATFYSTIWWSQMLEWEEQYGVKHTGLIIEEYSDQVSGEFDRNTEISQYLTFGNMLLNHGGELGFHGYNHMPLCLKGKDEERLLGDYKLWPNEEAIENSLKELADFSENLFPDQKFCVYVPPSNIMSESGKEALVEACPDIHIIASTLLTDAEGKAYEQEFGVDEDGMIHTPRITSGTLIDEYQTLTAFSELNFQFVQSHFVHPDDVLDEDRGAALGWECMKNNFQEYLDWIYASAPSIQNATGSEMGNAVKRYDKLTISKSQNENIVDVSLGGFCDEAYFLMRVNEGNIESIEGATYEKAANGLYLLHATKDSIQIELGELS